MGCPLGGLRGASPPLCAPHPHCKTDSAPCPQAGGATSAHPRARQTGRGLKLIQAVSLLSPPENGKARRLQDQTLSSASVFEVARIEFCRGDTGQGRWGEGVLGHAGPRRWSAPRGLRPTTGLTRHLGDRPQSPTLWPEGPQQLSSQPQRGQTFSFGPLFILSSAQTIDKPVIWLLMKFCTEQHGVTISGSKMSLEHMPLNAWYPGLTFCLMHNSPAVADPLSASPERQPGGHPGY